LFIRAKIRIARQNNLPRADFTKQLQTEINQNLPQQISLFVEKNRPIPKLRFQQFSHRFARINDSFAMFWSQIC